MKKYKSILLLPLVAVLSNPVMAHYGHDGYTKFDQRIERQHKRIKKGVRNDLLTKKEAKKLRKQHRYIKKLNRQFQKDGHLSRYERKTLQRELDLASKRIYRLKHNDRYRDYDSRGHGHHKKTRHNDSYRDRDHDHSVVLDYRDYY
jgi:hypothetical protein